MRVNGPDGNEQERRRLKQETVRLRAQLDRSTACWIEAAEAALAGDLKPLRLRVDMAKAGPPEFMEAGK